VIVGAGSAGCVLAGPLSEDPAGEVVLIEADPPDKAQEIHIPADWPQLFESRRDWDYASERELGLDRRRVSLPRGKTFGARCSLTRSQPNRTNWNLINCVNRLGKGLHETREHPCSRRFPLP
jgi:choline dehydrogenase